MNIEYWWHDTDGGDTEVFREKTLPVPLYLPHNPHRLAWNHTQTFKMTGWRVTTWAIAQPLWKEMFLLNPSITDWVQNVPRLCLFFNSSRWCTVTALPIFLFVLWSPLDTKLLCSMYATFFLNPTGSFCTHVSSICPTAKDRKTDWKYCQCSESVCKDHCITTVQITCNNWREQS